MSRIGREKSLTCWFTSYWFVLEGYVNQQVVKEESTRVRRKKREVSTLPSPLKVNPHHKILKEKRPMWINL